MCVLGGGPLGSAAGNAFADARGGGCFGFAPGACGCDVGTPDEAAADAAEDAAADAAPDAPAMLGVDVVLDAAADA